MELRERRARTLPARLRDRNQLKRDAPAVWDLQRASCTEQMMLHAWGAAYPEPEEPDASALTAAASALEAPMQRGSPMDDSRSEASAPLCEVKQSHSEASAEITSTVHLAAAAAQSAVIEMSATHGHMLVAATHVTHPSPERTGRRASIDE